MKDICGQEIAVGDRVVVAVSSYSSGKLTLAVIEQLRAATIEGNWDRVTVRTIPGKRRTICYAHEVLLAPPVSETE